MICYEKRNNGQQGRSIEGGSLISRGWFFKRKSPRGSNFSRKN